MTPKTQATRRRQAALKRQLEPCLRIGQQLSNMAFNYKQNDKLPEAMRENFRQLQQDWDKAKRSLPKWIR